MVGLEIAGQAAVADVQPLQEWPDGSLKWCMVRWVQDVRDGKVAETRLVERSLEITPQVVESTAGVTVSSDGTLDFRFGTCLLNATISCVTDTGHRFIGRMNRPLISKPGLVATHVTGTGNFIGVDGGALSLRFTISVLTCSSTLTSVVRFTVTNPQPAAHPNGNWDLGNGDPSIFANSISNCRSIIWGGAVRHRSFASQEGIRKNLVKKCFSSKRQAEARTGNHQTTWIAIEMSPCHFRDTSSNPEASLLKDYALRLPSPRMGTNARFLWG